MLPLRLTCFLFWTEFLVLREPQGLYCCELPRVGPQTGATFCALLSCYSFGTQGLAGGFCPKRSQHRFCSLTSYAHSTVRLQSGCGLLNCPFLSVQKPFLMSNYEEVFRTLKKKKIANVDSCQILSNFSFCLWSICGSFSLAKPLSTSHSRCLYYILIFIFFLLRE